MAANKSVGNTKKPPTKSEIYTTIADDTGLTKKDVAAVFDSLSGLIQKNLGGRGGPGMFTVPGLLKMRVVKKPARKASRKTHKGSWSYKPAHNKTVLCFKTFRPRVAGPFCCLNVF